MILMTLRILMTLLIFTLMILTIVLLHEDDLEDGADKSVTTFMMSDNHVTSFMMAYTGNTS